MEGEPSFGEVRSHWKQNCLPEGLQRHTADHFHTSIPTYEKVILGRKLHEVSSHRQKRSADQTVVQTPLDEFHRRNTEDYFKDEPDKERVGDGRCSHVVINCEYFEVSEVYAEADGIGEGREAVCDERHPFLH